MSTARHKLHAGGVYSLKYHLVWCPKFRRPVLSNGVDCTAKQVFQETAELLGVDLLAQEIMPDHVHLFVEGAPNRSVAEIVNRLKGRSARVLRQQHPVLRRVLPCMWSRSYFAGSVGAVSETTIRRYIAQQKLRSS